MRHKLATTLVKNLLVLLFATSFLIACNNESSTSAATKGSAAAANDTASFTTIQWIDSVKDIGQVPFGRTAHIDFTFKNSGTYPLFIVSVVPGCGCTVADYPKEAIAPGGTGVITAAFDSNKGSEGDFRKNIMVTTNTKGQPNQVLYFSGTIIKGQGADSTDAQKS